LQELSFAKIQENPNLKTVLDESEILVAGIVKTNIWTKLHFCQFEHTGNDKNSSILY
jgi:hypothetical protein